MKPSLKMLAVCAAIALPVAAFAGAAEEIAVRSEMFEAAFNAGDAAGVAALYTEDAVIMAPDTPRMDGRAAVQGLWQGFIDAGVTGLDLVTSEVEEFGDTANELGTFTLTAPDGEGGTVTLNGKYIVVWKRADGGDWHLDWDIWNLTP